MRISFVLPPVNMSGGIKVVAIYAKALADKGHEVFVVSPPQPGLSITDKAKAFLRGRGWPPESPKISPSYLDSLSVNHLVLDEYRAPTDKDIPDSDIIIATWWETVEWVYPLSDSKGAKVYFIQHHEVFDYLPVERCRETYRKPFHKVVIAQWLKELMLSEYGDGTVDLVPNSVDLDQFHAGPRGRQRRPTIGFLYSTTHFKGMDVTLEAISRLHGSFPNLRVVCFGSERPGKGVQLPGWVSFHFSPPQEEIRHLYAQCDVWVTASRSEGFNLPAMEAMACRTPVVSSRTGWPAEAIVNGKNGFLVDIDEVAALADAVAQVLSMADQDWQRLSSQAFETVSASSWAVSADLFERALLHACARAGRGEIAGDCAGAD